MFVSDEGKVCPRCRIWQPIESFAWRQKSDGKRQVYCRACMAAYNREHYLANKDLYIKRARERKAMIVRERAAFLVDFFRRNPCVDCGEVDPLVLEFDHLENKIFSIAEAIPERSWASILREIAKCEVVCANCHRRRTARRGGFARFLAVQAAG